MKRNLEPVDLMVAVGVFATLLGGALFFMATSEPVTAASSEVIAVGRNPDIMDAMQWIQPALGEGLVQAYLLKRKADQETAAAVTELNQVVLTAAAVTAPPFAQRAQVAAWASRAEAAHAARVQFVLGRLIVDYTARGVRNGALDAVEPYTAYNTRLMTIAGATWSRMQNAFGSHRQENLGEAVVRASQWHDLLAGKTQERIGKAVVHVAQVQDGYRDTSAALQAQLAAVALAGIRTEQQANLFASLAAADRAARGQARPTVEAKSWPEIPVGFWFAAFSVLIGAFFVGLLMPLGRTEPAAVGEMKKEETKAYRKTA